MSHALPRWWFVLLVALLVLAAAMVSDAFGIGGGTPGITPGSSPPQC